MTEDELNARSLLFIPADAERFIARGAERGADLIVLDLEDGVAPSARRAARAALAPAVAHLRAGGATVWVRVNNVPQLLAGDVSVAVASGAAGIVMPKVEAAAELTQLDAALLRDERAAGRPPGAVRLIPIAETPLGVCRAPEIAGACGRTVAVCFGAEDFSAAMGIEPLAEGMSWPAQAIAVAAAAAGLPALGLPGSVGDFSDLVAYRALAVHARRIGIRGAVCIHPAQVDVLNDVFGDSDADAAAATRLLAAFDAAVAKGHGAVALDGRMVDEPIAQRARRLLARRQARSPR